MPSKCKCQLKHASMEDLAKLGIGGDPKKGCTETPEGRYVCTRLDHRRRTHPKKQEWYARHGKEKEAVS